MNVYAKKTKGFSLLETLIAFVIFSSLILSLYAMQLRLMHQSLLLWQENQVILAPMPTHKNNE